MKIDASITPWAFPPGATAGFVWGGSYSGTTIS